MAQIDFVAHLHDDTDRYAFVLGRGPLDAPVSGCPGWDLTALTLHLGKIHRWARLSARTAARPERGAVPGPPDHCDDPGELATWLLDGSAALSETLVGLDPEAPTWHPFPVPLVAGLWPRRMAQETLVHRWDAESAIGPASPIDPVLAADGIDEYFTVMLPRLVVGTQLELPDGHVHVECTDVDSAWSVAARDGELFVTSGVTAAESDQIEHRSRAVDHAILRGSAEQLLLALWGRDGGGPLRVDGDAATAQALLALGGV
ncbi:maleylpyruvate isomerase family mycothiol-dependent enzyme [soil metagenome]